MKVCIFEDEGYKKLKPLTLFRPSFELKCGFTLLREKIERKFKGADISFLMRDYLKPTFSRRVPGYEVNSLNALKEDDLLLVNGRLLINEKVDISAEGDEEIAFLDETMVYARLEKKTTEILSSTDVDRLIKSISGKLKRKEIKGVTLINNLWDLINENPDAIVFDFSSSGGKIEGDFSPQAVIVGDKSKVYIGKGARVHPFVVIDTEGGPVIIDEGAIVYPYTRIEGPSCIGKNTKVVGAKIREGCSIGPVCMVGGEIEETIIQGYSNKYHDGFIGHAYICEWVNLGALTTNSDIKNNYGPVKIYVDGELKNSGELKLGSFIGDNSKLGIGTLLNTGAVIGACSNVFNGGMPPKFVPSFSWGAGDSFAEFNLDKAIETSRKVMSRRKVTQTNEDIELIKKVYEITIPERRKSGMHIECRT